MMNLSVEDIIHITAAIIAIVMLVVIKKDIDDECKK